MIDFYLVEFAQVVLVFLLQVEARIASALLPW